MIELAQAPSPLLSHKDMKITGPVTGGGEVRLSEADIDRLAVKIGEAIARALSGGATAVSFTPSLSRSSGVTMDESIVDIGVSLDGIEASSGSIASTTTTADDTSSAKNKLKNLKKK